jgi:two-component system nitrogen regulation sensor histidine kinase GlnL
MRRALETGETLSEREMAVMTGPLGREHRVIDFTLTPLDSEFERKYLLLEISDATQRQRITRENELMARLDSSRQMVRQLAHEIKNPLGGLRGARAAAGARIARAPARVHRRDHQGPTASRRWSTSMIGPARAPRNLINVHELCEHVFRLLRRGTRQVLSNATTTLLPNAEVIATRSSRRC